MTIHELSILFESTDTPQIIRDLAFRVAENHEVSLAGNDKYISLSPKAVQLIAIYLQATHVSIGLTPESASNWAIELPGSRVEEKTGVTHYLKVPESTINSHFQIVLNACLEALSKAEQGSDATSKPGLHQKIPAAQFCDKCFMQLPGTGICESSSCN